MYLLKKTNVTSPAEIIPRNGTARDLSTGYPEK
jgi:hypothetical protein